MEIVIPDWDTDELSREDLLDVLKDTLEAEDVIVKSIDGHIYPPAVRKWLHYLKYKGRNNHD